MNKAYMLALAATIMTAPLALAHDPAGTLKNHCEDPSEWYLHEYAPVATGHLIALGQDGNLAEDCNGDTIPADYDGHSEWAIGGAWLASESGDGATSGSLVCYGEPGHHPAFGPFTVEDLVFGDTLPFSVTSDTVNLVPPTDPAEPNCGDFEADNAHLCLHRGCRVTFGAGIDGVYNIFVCVIVSTSGVTTCSASSGHTGSYE